MAEHSIKVLEIFSCSWRQLAGEKWSFARLLILFAVFFFLVLLVDYYDNNWSYYSIRPMLMIMIFFIVFSALCGGLVKNALRIVHGRYEDESLDVAKDIHKLMLISSPACLALLLVRYVPYDVWIIILCAYILTSMFLSFAIYVYFERGNNYAWGAMKESCYLVCHNFFAYIRLAIFLALTSCYLLYYFVFSGLMGYAIVFIGEPSYNTMVEFIIYIILPIVPLFWLIPLCCLIKANFTLAVLANYDSMGDSIANNSYIN